MGWGREPPIGTPADRVDTAVDARRRGKPTASSGHWRDRIPGVDLRVVHLGGAEVGHVIGTPQRINPAIEAGGSGQGAARCSHPLDAFPRSGRWGVGADCRLRATAVPTADYIDSPI